MLEHGCSGARPAPALRHTGRKREGGIIRNAERRGKGVRGLSAGCGGGLSCYRNMKQLTVVVKPFRAEAVLRAVAELGVTSCVVREAKGYSRQKGYLDRYAGSEYSMAFLPKVEISVCVGDERAEEVADQIVRAARTGRMGDGKVFVVPLGWPDALEF